MDSDFGFIITKYHYNVIHTCIQHSLKNNMKLDELELNASLESISTHSAMSVCKQLNIQLAEGFKMRPGLRSRMSNQGPWRPERPSWGPERPG